MSFKYQAVNVSDSHLRLTAGEGVPVDIFMNQNLYDASEEEMWQQAVWARTIPTVERVVITPDAHAGAGVPVGLVIGTKEYVAPCAAGYDIGCGMLSMTTGLNKDDIADKAKRRSWINALEKRIAFGMGKHQVQNQYRVSANKLKDILVEGVAAFEHTSKYSRFERIKHPVSEYTHYEDAFDRGFYQLSSLGGGNHFLELQQDMFGSVWVMIHTGSRGYGHQVATQFFNEGREWYNNENEKPLAPKDKEKVVFPVESSIGKRYLNAMAQAANFALVNRYLLAKAVAEATEEVFNAASDIYYEISHNLVQYEDGLWVHRKGATRAFPADHPILAGTGWEDSGHPVLIPGSMGTSSAILFPLAGSKESLYSVNHGCGRVMSRGKAKRTLDQGIVDKEMDDLDIIYNSRNVPIDESMHCYKDIDEVLDTVESAKLAAVTHRLYPRAVLKGND